jgi:polyferredoxin
MQAQADPQLAYEARQAERPPARLDLLRLPLLGPFLRWRHARLVLQLPLFALALVLVLHGLYGPDLAPKNLATVLTWVHYRGALVLVLLIAGNFFCLGCPFLLPRELARRFFRPRWSWPRWLRNKWLTVALFGLVLFVYELFALWSDPWLTAGLILAYFAGALVVDALFTHASFCKWVCPLGQFNFVASTVSPLEIAVREPATCARCATKDCIRGTPAPENANSPGRLSLPLVQRGCELALFQPLKVGNMDCTFCLDCVHACPHDNVGLVTRMPGSELWADTPRSGVGNFAERPDLAALVVVFTFGALLNAFGMVSPVYAVQAWLSRALGTEQRGPILGLLFLFGLVFEPVLLLGLAAWATRRLVGARERLLVLATRYAYSLVPLGFAVWLAHYAFHFLTGALTFVPVAQLALVDLSWPVLGAPRWQLGGMREASVYPLELGMLGLGLVGSWIVALRLARQDCPAAAPKAAAPWLLLHLLLFLSAVWLLSQPMEMRGTFLGVSP